MVQDSPNNTFAALHSYEQIDAIVERAARLLLCRWERSASRQRSKEGKILTRLKQIAAYFDTTNRDEYLSNLYLIFVGSRSEGKPLSVALMRMENVRELILNENYSKGLSELTQYIYDDDPTTKIKYLLRFVTVKQAARLLYDQLNDERRKIGKAELSAVPEFNGSPDKFTGRLNDFLKNYK